MHVCVCVHVCSWARVHVCVEIKYSPIKNTSIAMTRESKECYCWKKLVIIVIDTLSYDPFDLLQPLQQL